VFGLHSPAWGGQHALGVRFIPVLRTLLDGCAKVKGNADAERGCGVD